MSDQQGPRFTITTRNSGVDPDQDLGTVRLVLDLPVDVAVSIWQALGREILDCGEAVKAAYPQEWAQYQAQLEAEREDATA